MYMTAPVVIQDLNEPLFSPEADELRSMMDQLAADCPLDSDALHAKAVAESGLDDFGPRDYVERLEVLLEALRAIPGLNGPGRVNFHAQVVQMLRNRLQLTDLLRRHPEIADIELVPPVVIAGLPRTGTTHLHNLMASAPTFRTLPYWESIEPVPRPDEVGVDPDPRRERCDQAVWFADLAMPLFPLMHEMTTDHVHEEIQLLANDFSTMFFETVGDVPGWRDYYCAHDQAPHYRYLTLQLKAMQHLRGGRRWLLKSPQHLEQLPVLEEVFPGLTTVITHRDPVSVVVSMATMVAYTARMHRSPVPAEHLGRYWADRIERMLNKLVADRHCAPADRSVDIRFDEFMADDLGTVARVYALAGEPMTADAEAAMAAYLAGHRRGHLGTIDYRPADLGLDLDDLRARFAPYVARFLTD